MIRKKKHYVKPRKLYEKQRIAEENTLLEKYGLKNKHEIWKTLAKVNYFRHRAMALAKAPLKEQQVLFDKLNAIGIPVKSTADVLALKIEDILNRRLPTIVAQKKLSSTAKQARQMVVHKRIIVSGRIVDAPSYLVSVAEENSITLKTKEQIHQKKETLSDEAQKVS